MRSHHERTFVTCAYKNYNKSGYNNSWKTIDIPTNDNVFSLCHRHDDESKYQSRPSSNTVTTTTIRTITTRPVANARARRVSVRARIQKQSLQYKKPTLEIANSMPLSLQEMDNMAILTMGAMGSHSARIEILKRHIMSVDKVSYDAACVKFVEICNKNDENVWLLSLPYRFGIVFALSTAVISIPMVFDLSTAHWFNYAFVTTDVPEPKDVETIFEVGA